jgi:transcription-repair coupling factor (superfamily II helicase)
MPEGVAVAPLELPIDHFLPHDYVPDEKVRLQVYQELAAATQEVHLQTMARRLKDRFGALPGPVENLLFSLRVKLLAQAAGLVSVNLSDGALELRLPADHDVDLESVASRHRHVNAKRSRVEFGWRAAGEDWRDALADVLTDIGRLRAAA